MNARKQNGVNLEFLSSYVLGRVEQFIIDFATSAKVSADELTGRVSELLQAQTGRPLLGLEHRLPDLQRESAQGSPAPQPLEVAVSTHNGAQSAGVQSAEPLVKMKGHPKGYKYPPGTHWTQKKENKARMRRITNKAHAAFQKAHPGKKRYNGRNERVVPERVPGSAALKDEVQPEPGWTEKFVTHEAEGWGRAQPVEAIAKVEKPVALTAWDVAMQANGAKP
jgi:hypothetical protein